LHLGSSTNRSIHQIKDKSNNTDPFLRIANPVTITKYTATPVFPFIFGRIWRQKIWCQSQIPPPFDRFEVFRNNVEGHYGQSGAGYLFGLDFQTAYLERVTDYSFVS
jgi:hypothetical protein